jgi:aminoglycoside 6'-N-acetyltransferase I
MRVRRYTPADRKAYQRMREALWPDCTDADNDVWFAREDATTFLAVRDDGALCGFVEVGARSIADSCLTSPVGYIEGWWVDADVRNRGVGRALLVAAEEWARSRGYREMASDALADNSISIEAHQRCGYEKLETVTQFRKSLG